MVAVGYRLRYTLAVFLAAFLFEGGIASAIFFGAGSQAAGHLFCDTAQGEDPSVHLLVGDEYGEDAGEDIDQDVDGFGGAAEPVGEVTLEGAFVLHGCCAGLR